MMRERALLLLLQLLIAILDTIILFLPLWSLLLFAVLAYHCGASGAGAALE